MKVIDLLNKIANGEEVPKKFMVDGDTLYIGEDKFIEYANGERIEWFIYPSWLNEEVETIKEDKKIEKFETYKITDETISGLIKSINELNKDIEKKLNEIIDYINGGTNE